MTERTVPSEIGVPYPALPISQAHPSRIAALCWLRGLSSASPTNCHVLELGCASGGNLLPLAVTYPRSKFVGVDVDRPEVQKAQGVAARLGLENVTFLAIGVEAALDSLGDGPRFDYIIAHGLYSWIPETAREAMLRLCGSVLADRGVVYVSYNASPGGHLRDSLRDILKFNVRRAKNAQEAVASTRSFLNMLERAQVAQSWPRVAQYELADALRGNDTRFLFDDLAPGASFFLEELVASAERYGLAFAGEALPSASLRLPFGGLAKKVLEGLSRDSLEQESLLDLLMLRRFRRTLLCRQGSLPSLSLDESALDASHVAAPFIAPPRGAFGASWAIPGANGQQIQLDTPLAQAALVRLGLRYPESIALSQLAQEAAVLLPESARGTSGPSGPLNRALLELYEHGIVDLFSEPVPCTRAPGETPRGFAYARAAVELARPIVNLLHHPVSLEVTDAKLLGLLDGSYSKADLSEALAREDLGGYDLEGGLARLAQRGLLMAASA